MLFECCHLQLALTLDGMPLCMLTHIYLYRLHKLDCVCGNKANFINQTVARGSANLSVSVARRFDYLLIHQHSASLLAVRWLSRSLM